MEEWNTAAMARERTFVIAAGGTGGHVIPALETARELRRRGHRCVFVGSSRGMENRLVPEAGFELERVEIGALNAVSLARRLTTLAQAPRSLWQAAAILRKHRPDAALSLGGYASGPLSAVALMTGVPLAVLEPNAYPGMANRWVGRFAKYALLGFDEASRWFPKGRAETCGVPVRAEFFDIKPRRGGKTLSVLITGGSQGSRTLNRAGVEAARLWHSTKVPVGLRILHQTGVKEYNIVQSAYEALAGSAPEIELRATPFIDDMPSAFAEADLVVSRAGASALAEVAAAGRAALLIPFPYAADQHQMRNARAAEAAGAGRVVADDEWTGERMKSEIEAVLAEPERLAEMQHAARAMARPGAAGAVADRLEALAVRS